MQAMTAAPTTNDWQVLLAQGLATLGEHASAPTLAAFDTYCALLHKWSRAYNLTAVTEPFAMLRQHFLDSASVLPHLAGPRVLDVGTGAGFPGLVIALLRPDWHVTVVDSVAKKTRFCTQVAHALGLTNVSVLHARVEAEIRGESFDDIVSRAFASLGQFVDLSARHLSAKGRLVAMKGKVSDTELAAVAAFRPRVVPLVVPGLEVTRHAVIMQPESSHQ